MGIFKNLIKMAAALALPWIAGFITKYRYTDKRSRLLDKLLILAEGDE